MGRSSGGRVRPLLVDNYDSYTYNLYQLIAMATGKEPIVVRNDELSSNVNAAREFTHVVISPGPGHPGNPRDFGHCLQLIRTATVPILGVCLGHQGIAQAFGGAIRQAQPAHGRKSAIYHDDSILFRGVPQGCQGVRYHSLVVDAVPDDIAVIAWTDDHTIMGICHRTRPLWGVQFHPESIATEHGLKLLANFFGIAPEARSKTFLTNRNSSQPQTSATTARARYRRLDRWHDPEECFSVLFGHERYAFWLDSSRTSDGLARFSFMGVPDGPHGHGIEYDTAQRIVQVRRDGSIETKRESIFDFLNSELAARHVANPGLPFDFLGGYVGYLGYEVKGECGGQHTHPADTPDASFLYIERFLAFDHQQRTVFLVQLMEPNSEDEDWFDLIEQRLTAGWKEPQDAPPRGDDPMPHPALTRDAYHQAFHAVQEYLSRGESYQVNLTYPITFRCAVDHLHLYRRLRSGNPAPYAAFLRLGKLSVMSSSPERFLRVWPDGRVETKPIKGTLPREKNPGDGAVLRKQFLTDDKMYAEHLMIVDLLRNDLGQVCQVGSVQAPSLMEVESYPTLHHLVSTITGQLRSDIGAVDCIRAMFPGGSMTGAPKIRTMDIIDTVEGRPRGIYSGILGYLSHSGSADFSIVIRTLVAQGENVSIGVGGGIVALSDPDAEYHETILKAQALIRAVRLTSRQSKI